MIIIRQNIWAVMVVSAGCFSVAACDNKPANESNSADHPGIGATSNQPLDIDRPDPSEYAEPTLEITEQGLQINGSGFEIEDAKINDLAAILGPWGKESSSGAYAVYAWERAGLFALGYGENVQHIYILYDPTRYNRSWELNAVPFTGMVLIEGYLVSSSLSSQDWGALFNSDDDDELEDGMGFYKMGSTNIQVHLTESRESIDHLIISSR